MELREGGHEWNGGGHAQAQFPRSIRLVRAVIKPNQAPGAETENNRRRQATMQTLCLVDINGPFVLLVL